ncbi:TPA: DUF551 domain-containing protein [Klebsiella pneumoniae]
MTKSTITREQLLEIIETDHVQCGEASYLARMVLAAMDSEPVIVVGDDGGDALSYRRLIQSFEPGTKLYRHAQPAPVVPDSREQFEAWAKKQGLMSESFGIRSVNEQFVNSCWEAWQESRAAMLQAEPVTTANKLGNSPAQSPIDHGYRHDCECGGCKATVRICAELCWCRTCRPVVWNDMRFVVCPDCGNKRCPRANDHRNACTGSNEPGQEGSSYPSEPVWVGVDWAKGCKPGNSPVVPDGYVMVPKEATLDMLKAGAKQEMKGEAFQYVWQAMLAAAPQSPGSEPAAEPGKWIPVSDRMPGNGIQVLVSDVSGHVFVCHHNGSFWVDFRVGIGKRCITHWMPLPAPPKEVK